MSNDNHDTKVAMMLILRAYFDGLTLDEWCKLSIVRSGPSSFTMPVAFGRKLVRELVDTGNVLDDAKKGRAKMYRANRERLMLPAGYLYGRLRRGDGSMIETIETPFWRLSGSRLVLYVEKDRVETFIDAPTKAGFRMLCEAVCRAGFEVHPPKGARSVVNEDGERVWADPFGYVRAPFDRIEALASWLAKNASR